MAELLGMDEPRKRFAAMMSGLDIHYDLGEGHPLLGRRMPDLDLVTADGPLRVFTLLHDARPVLLNLGEPGGFDIAPWADRVQLIDARYDGAWELPAVGAVTAPTALLIRPDGYVAWVGDRTGMGLADALTTWFGPPTRRRSAPAFTIIRSQRPRVPPPSIKARSFGGQVWRENLNLKVSDQKPVPAPVLAWQQEVHIPGIYDLEVDTSSATPYDCALIIRRRLENRADCI